MVNDHFGVNKDVSLHSMKYIFDNDLMVVNKYLFNKFPNTYNNIAIFHVKRNKIDNNGYE